MKLDGISFRTTDWSAVEPTMHPGEAGVATWRTSIAEPAGDPAVHRRLADQAPLNQDSSNEPWVPCGGQARVCSRPLLRRVPRACSVAGMIRGVHALVHTSDPHATRAFFRDALGLPGVDIGEGQWICTLAEANVACTRPGSEDPGDAAGLSLLCDDLRGTVAGLKSRGVQFTHEIENHGYALVTYLTAPGGVTVMLFEPRYRKRSPSKPTSQPKRTEAKRKPSAKPALKRSGR